MRILFGNYVLDSLENQPYIRDTKTGIGSVLGMRNPQMKTPEQKAAKKAAEKAKKAAQQAANLARTVATNPTIEFEPPCSVEEFYKPLRSSEAVFRDKRNGR